jgi:MGT family glycosyltransferase
MTNFWFVSAPLVSHTDWGGFLKTALALKAQGHGVTWVSEARIGGLLAQHSLDFAPVRQTGWLWPLPPAPDVSKIPPQEAVMLRYRRALDTWLSEDLVGDAVDALCELAGQIGKSDVIVTDPFLSAAALAAERLDVPLAVCGWPALSSLNEEFLYPVQRLLGQDSQDRMTRLYERFGLTGVNFAEGPTPSILSPHLHISYFTEDWYQADSAYLLDQTLFVGGLPEPPDGSPPQWLRDIPPAAPLALITLGSIFTGDLGFFSWAAQAAARVGYVPVVVLGWNPIAPDAKAELKAALPKTTRLLNWVDFRHVLPRTRLMVHHGGMGTTHAAVVYGIPQMVVPHAADQRGQARRVAQAKVGLNLTAHDVRNGALLEGARAISRDERVQATARALADEMAALGGPAAAAQALLQVAG